MIIASMLFNDDSKSYSPVLYHIFELKSLTRHHEYVIGYPLHLKIFIIPFLDIIFQNYTL